MLTRYSQGIHKVFTRYSQGIHKLYTCFADCHELGRASKVCRVSKLLVVADLIRSVVCGLVSLSLVREGIVSFRFASCCHYIPTSLPGTLRSDECGSSRINRIEKYDSRRHLLIIAATVLRF